MNAHRIFVRKPLGRRPLGRSKRWEKNMNMDLREVNYKDRRWIK
jgi:hypothetical protein